MVHMSPEATSQASRNAMLAAKVSRALHQIDEGRPLSPKDQRVLQRGGELLNQILQGALLIGGQAAAYGVSPSASGLRAFGKALSAVQQLKEMSEEPDIAATFQLFRNELAAVEGGRPIRDEQRAQLRHFFSVLGSVFQRDLEDVAFAEGRDELSTT